MASLFKGVVAQVLHALQEGGANHDGRKFPTVIKVRNEQVQHCCPAAAAAAGMARGWFGWWGKERPTEKCLRIADSRIPQRHRQRHRVDRYG